MKSKKTAKIKKENKVGKSEAVCEHNDCNNIEIYAGDIIGNIFTEYGVCKLCNTRFATSWQFVRGMKYWNSRLGTQLDVLEHDRIHS